MTSLHPNDGDLHTNNGGHRKTPPKEATAELDEAERLAYERNWARRLRRHLLAHATPAPVVSHQTRPIRVQRRAPAGFAQLEALAILPFANEVKRHMRARNVTNAEAAAWLNMSRKVFDDRLYGAAKFTLAEAVFLCRQLGLSAEDILLALAEP